MRKFAQFKIKPFIAVPFLVVWILGVILRYLYYDDRFHLLHFLISSSSNFVLLFAMVLAAFCLGEKTWYYLGIHFSTCLETFVFSTALGFGITSFLVLLLGVCHLLYKASCYFLLLGIIVFSIPRIWSFVKRFREEHQIKKTENNSLFIIVVWVIFTISTCLYLVQVFSPPMNYDSLAYHMAIPKLFAGEHQVLYIPRNVYANFPMTMEFLYLISLLLRGDTLAKLTHFFMGIISILAIYSFSRRHFDRKTALVASLLFYNIPLVGLLSGWAFNDLMLTAYEFLAVAAIVNWFSSKPVKNHGILNRPSKENWLSISAIFCGLSIGTKYPAFLLLLPFLLVTITIKLLFIDSKNFLCWLKRVGLFLLIVLAVVSPWFVKNIFYTHNPVYPFFHSFFNNLLGHPGGEAFDIQRFVKHHQPGDFHGTQILSLLWKTNMDRMMGPALILFLPLLIFARPIKPEVRLILLFGSLYFVLWSFFTHQDIRFLIPSLPALCIASAYAISGTAQKSKPLTLLMHLVILFIVLFNLSWIPLTIAKYDLLKVAVGIENRDEFLMSSPLYQYPAFHYINSELPEDAKVLFVGENQTYYCDREVVSNSPFDTNVIAEIVNKSSSERHIRDKLKSLGITHVLYNASETKRVAESYNSFNWSSEEASNLFFGFLTSGQYLKENFFHSGVFVGELVVPHE